MREWADRAAPDRLSLDRAALGGAVAATAAALGLQGGVGE